jgi:hypothetical protein
MGYFSREVSSIGDIPEKLGPERGSGTKEAWLTNWKLLIFISGKIFEILVILGTRQKTGLGVGF